MGKVCAVISCWLVTVAGVTAQTVRTSERLLPQWLTGLIAMSAFLFLAFVFFLVKKAWCEKSSRRRSAEESVRENELVMTNGNTVSLDGVRTKEDLNVYDNLVFDSAEDRVTPMWEELMRRNFKYRPS